MNYLFLVNNIIEFIADGKLERILWINESYTYCYTIELSTKKFTIRKRNVLELESWIDQQTLRVCMDDPTLKIILEEKITEESKRLRDNALKIVSYICTDNEPDVYNEAYRSQLIGEARTEFSVSKKSIYKYLRKYWQGGRMPNSLLPLLDRCGGRGKRKTLSDKKLGRRNTISYFDETKQGINLTDEIRDIFGIAIRKHYLNSRKNSFNKAYQFMLEEYFSDTVLENGETKKQIRPNETIPTYFQFRHWYYEGRDIELEIISRNGSKDFSQNHREITSNSTYETFGSGFRYQIDAANFGIYLVNELNRNYSVGRVTYYLVPDVFSRLYTGIYVGLDSPSGMGALSALYNCTEDKVEFCKKYGIEITPDQWPNSGLPRNLLADRGELVGKIPEKAVVNLEINMENTPSYSPDLKGIVERGIGLIEMDMKSLFSGIANKGYKKRGERDPRLYAKLTLYEVTKALIWAVIHHNNSYIEDYPMTPELIQDGVQPIPVKLWEWGLKNKAGNLRHWPEDYIKKNLMRSAKAQVTERGIIFNGNPYQCETARKENWYVIARNKGKWSIDVVYDDRNSSVIWISDTMEPCTISEEYGEFGKFRYEEINQYYSVIKNVEKAKVKNSLNQNDVDFIHHGKQIAKEAEKDFRDKNGSNTLGREGIKDIKENRKIENEKYRQEQAFKLSENNPQIESIDNSEGVFEEQILEPRQRLVERLAILNQRKSL